MREKFKKKFYEFKKLLFHRNTAPFVLAEPLQLYNKSLFRSFCNAKLQRALVLLFNRCSNARVLAEPLQLYKKSLIRSFCSAKLQRAPVLLFHRNTAPFVLAEPLQLYTNASYATFAVQNCSEHLFYCFTGVPTPGCSQTPSLYTNAHSAAFA